MRARKKVRHRPWGPDSQRAYTANAVSKARREAQPALRQFWGWLDHDRCLSPGTITVRVSSARSLVDALCTREPLKQTLARWTAVDVEDFFVRYCRNHGPAARRSMQAALRLFLRFAAAEGWASTELVHAVPSLRTYGLSGVPRGLAESDVDRLLRSLGGNDVSARDRAIVLLLVVYGIRRGQICALRLEDLDWRERRITFRAHKGGKAIQHELIPPVADTIAMYLRHERPACADATVFLRAKKPYQALSPAAVTQTVRSRLDRVGIVSAPRGPHALRHAFATRLLRAGRSLKTIADLLGHRSLSATSVYAKVDHARLLEVAAAWPEVSS